MKYLNNSIKRSSTSYIMNIISNFLIIVLILVLAALYIRDIYEKQHVELNYLEMKLSYKNCIIVEKSDKNGYMLYLKNPYLKSNDLIDYTICVKDYIYFNWFIGDTIK